MSSRRLHVRGCPTLSHTAGCYWKDKPVCTCPPRVYKPKRKPTSKAWDNANSQPDLGQPTGPSGCYVQRIRHQDRK